MIVVSLIGLGTMIGVLNAGKAPAVKKTMSAALKDADNKVQTFIATRIDPLFDNEARSEQIADFAADTTPQEKKTNRIVAVAVGSAGLAGAGLVVGSPALLVVSGAVTIAITVSGIRYALAQSFREKRVKFILLAYLNAIPAVLSGFFVTAALFKVVIRGAFKFRHRTETMVQKSMLGVFGLAEPEYVWILSGGQEIEIAFSKLKPGDTVIVDAGQVIPIDGIVTKGVGAVDQHAMTGESRLATKEPGDAVLANTLLANGRLFVHVEKHGAETTAAQIGQILTQATNFRLEATAKSEQMLDRAAPFVLGAAGVAYAGLGVASAATVLSSGLGVNVLIAAPLTSMSYLNISSQMGILVKDGRSLETLSTVDTVVFDKTGTLTLEQPLVGAINSVGVLSEDRILALAACAEYRQSHPVARAILEEAKARGLSAGAPDSADYTTGMGIRIVSSGRDILVGSARFLESNGVRMPVAAQGWAEAAERIGGSLVHVALNGVSVGAIELHAQLRPGVESLLADLRKNGIETYILSGDAETPTRHLSETLGMDGYFAGVLPDQKASIVKGLQAQSRVVCFVGDGINDALALKAADISISLRGATTLATDSAQVVLMGGSLDLIRTLFDIGRDFDKSMSRTMALAFVPGIGVISSVFLFGIGLPTALLVTFLGVSASIANALSPKLRIKPPEQIPPSPNPNPNSAAVIETDNAAENVIAHDPGHWLEAAE